MVVPGCQYVNASGGVLEDFRKFSSHNNVRVPKRLGGFLRDIAVPKSSEYQNASEAERAPGGGILPRFLTASQYQCATDNSERAGIRTFWPRQNVKMSARKAACWGDHRTFWPRKDRRVTRKYQYVRGVPKVLPRFLGAAKMSKCQHANASADHVAISMREKGLRGGISQFPGPSEWKNVSALEGVLGEFRTLWPHQNARVTCQNVSLIFMKITCQNDMSECVSVKMPTKMAVFIDILTCQKTRQ